jgi:hypothetical protein
MLRRYGVTRWGWCDILPSIWRMVKSRFEHDQQLLRTAMVLS